MVAQPVMTPVVGFDSGTVAENALVIWAVFDVLESVPATPETQNAFDVARISVQRQIEAVGIDTSQVDLAFASAEMPKFESRGDPPSC